MISGRKEPGIENSMYVVGVGNAPKSWSKFIQERIIPYNLLFPSLSARSRFSFAQVNTLVRL
jgi:hypothetical protein